MKTVVRRYTSKKIFVGIVSKDVDYAEKLRAYPRKKKRLPLEHERFFKYESDAEAYAEKLHAMIKAG